jgi:hypothetical protein
MAKPRPKSNRTPKLPSGPLMASASGVKSAQAANDLFDTIFSRSSGAKKMTGLSEAGVSPYKLVAVAFAKAAARVGKSASDWSDLSKKIAADEAASLSRNASVAVKFPNSPGARSLAGTVNKVVSGAYLHDDYPTFLRANIPGTTVNLNAAEIKILARSAKKFTGRLGSTEPGLRMMGEAMKRVSRGYIGMNRYGRLKK